MTTCDDVQRAMTAGDEDETTRAHLVQCPDCRAFELAHRAARHARHVEPRLPTRVRRRAVVSRAALVSMLVAGLVGAGLWSSGAPASTATAPEPGLALPETSLTAAPRAPDHDEEWAALVAFTHGLDDTLYRDVTTSDATYAAFGALPRWVAPQSTLTALEN